MVIKVSVGRKRMETGKGIEVRVAKVRVRGGGSEGEGSQEMERARAGEERWDERNEEVWEVVV